MKIKQTHFTLLLALLLLISLAVNIFQAQERPASVRGTFLHGDTYLVFSHRGINSGVFIMYRNSDVLEEGRYSYLGDGIYDLRDKSGEFIRQVLFRDDYIYIFDLNEEIVRFHRIYRTGLLLGIEPDYELWTEA